MWIILSFNKFTFVSLILLFFFEYIAHIPLWYPFESSKDLYLIISEAFEFYSPTTIMLSTKVLLSLLNPKSIIIGSFMAEFFSIVIK